ncbi:MAG: hypothetical protein QM723_21870 [Myxococcaceae bacterium]
MKRGLPAVGAVLFLACSASAPSGWVGDGGGGSGGGMDVAAAGPSHSSTLILGASNQLLAVNPLMDALITSRLDPGTPAIPAARFSSGSQPSSVALTPDGTLIYVTLRGTGALLRMSNPTQGGSVLERLQVGSEPVAVALSPRGKLSVVALAGEPAAVVVDNARGVLHRIELPGVTRAVAITNTGADDADEKAYVTLFFAGAGVEGSDTGREGLVAKLNLRTFSLEQLIHLKPIADTGWAPQGPDAGNPPNVSCFPNQLSSILISGGRAFVAGICASPEPPLYPFTMAFSAVSVIDLATDTEVTGPAGSATLAKWAQGNASLPMSLFANPVDLAVENDVLYVLSQGSDRVVAVSLVGDYRVAANGTIAFTDPMCGYAGCGPRVEDPDAGDGDPAAGTQPGNCGACDGCCQGNDCIPATQVSSFACGLGGVACTICDTSAGACTGGFCAPFAAAPVGVPTGVVVSGGTVVVNDISGLQLMSGFGAPGGLPFGSRAYGAPGHGGAPGHRALQGLRFFDTALDRWSAAESLSCATCHPDGRSDSVTWVFGAGPRQTVALDGTFAKGDVSDHRAQNWTAVADEIYDVEGLVRSTMRGLGALTTGAPNAETAISLTAGISIDGRPVTRNDGLNGSSRLVSDELSLVKDWAQLEEFVQQVHTPAAPSGLDALAVVRGRAVYAMAGCDGCHAGPKWTVSRVPYVPSPELNGSAMGDNGMPAVATGLRTVSRAKGLPGLNFDTMEVATEHLPNPDGGADLSVGPERITCVLRAVGTFDASNPLEKKADGTRAQGALGFNVPSLLGVGTTAPYFHHGAAATLADVFSPAFAQHYQAGNGGFSPTPGQVQDLVTFLRSIDETTLPFALKNDVCGQY